jgi:hypothetical protein
MAPLLHALEESTCSRLGSETSPFLLEVFGHVNDLLLSAGVEPVLLG